MSAQTSDIAASASPQNAAALEQARHAVALEAALAAAGVSFTPQRAVGAQAEQYKLYLASQATALKPAQRVEGKLRLFGVQPGLYDLEKSENGLDLLAGTALNDTELRKVAACMASPQMVKRVTDTITEDDRGLVLKAWDEICEKETISHCLSICNWVGAAIYRTSKKLVHSNGVVWIKAANAGQLARWKCALFMVGTYWCKPVYALPPRPERSLVEILQSTVNDAGWWAAIARFEEETRENVYFRVFLCALLALWAILAVIIVYDAIASLCGAVKKLWGQRALLFSFLGYRKFAEKVPVEDPLLSVFNESAAMEIKQETFLICTDKFGVEKKMLLTKEALEAIKTRLPGLVPANPQESLQNGSPLRVVKRADWPKYVMRVSFRPKGDTAFYALGVAFRCKQWIFTAAHLFNKCMPGDRILLQSAKGEYEFEYATSETSRDYDHTAITMWTDTVATRFSDKVWTALGGVTSLEITVPSLDQQFEVYGALSTDPQDVLKRSTGQITHVDITSVHHNASTQNGHSGSPLVTIGGKPKLIALHLSGASGAGLPNKGAHLYAMEKILSKWTNEESSETYFIKYIKDHHKEMLDEKNENRWKHDRNGGEYYYFRPDGRGYVVVSEDEYRQISSNAQEYIRQAEEEAEKEERRQKAILERDALEESDSDDEDTDFENDEDLGSMPNISKKGVIRSYKDREFDECAWREQRQQITQAIAAMGQFALDVKSKITIPVTPEEAKQIATPLLPQVPNPPPQEEKEDVELQESANTSSQAPAEDYKAKYEALMKKEQRREEYAKKAKAAKVAAAKAATASSGNEQATSTSQKPPKQAKGKAPKGASTQKKQ